jgi:hypothetical protein
VIRAVVIALGLNILAVGLFLTYTAGLVEGVKLNHSRTDIAVFAR